VLWQTTTLELRRDGERLLIDPGIAPWEVEEAAGDGAGHVLLTHGDWDHVMGVGLLPDARVVASEQTARRIASGEAEQSVRKESAVFCLPLEGLEGLRVDQTVAPGELTIGSWQAVVHAAPGHTDDGLSKEHGRCDGDELDGLVLTHREPPTVLANPQSLPARHSRSRWGNPRRHRCRRLRRTNRKRELEWADECCPCECESL